MSNHFHLVRNVTGSKWRTISPPELEYSGSCWQWLWTNVSDDVEILLTNPDHWLAHRLLLEDLCVLLLLLWSVADWVRMTPQCPLSGRQRPQLTHCSMPWIPQLTGSHRCSLYRFYSERRNFLLVFRPVQWHCDKIEQSWIWKGLAVGECSGCPVATKGWIWTNRIDQSDSISTGGSWPGLVWVNMPEIEECQIFTVTVTRSSLQSLLRRLEMPLPSFISSDDEVTTDTGGMQGQAGAALTCLHVTQYLAKASLKDQGC